MRKSSLTILMIIVAGMSAAAQESKVDPVNDKCADRIYQSKEVTQRAKLGNGDAPTLPPEAIAHSVRGRVLLTAVLCRTGKVTDIKVVEGLPYGVTEKAVEAARSTEFQPAEINGSKVSTTMQFDYNFSYLGERRPLAKEPIAGRMIETVEINATEKLSLDEIWKMLKTQSGEPYNPDLVASDLRALLALGILDPNKTLVRVEEGLRDGVQVVFELHDKSVKH